MVSKFKLDTNKSGDTKEAISRTLAIANNYAGELSIEVLKVKRPKTERIQLSSYLTTLSYRYVVIACIDYFNFS